MKCPYCDHVFPLTWRRYFASPLGGHRCPQCQQQARLSHTSAYYTALLTTVIVFAVAFISPAIYFETSPLVFYIQGYHVIWVLGALILFVLLDKNFDEQLRPLEKSSVTSKSDEVPQ
jgi:hypothetical protein